jgi:hypothetical protein
MFPRLCETFRELVPELYFGGDEVPPYLIAVLPENASIEDIVAMIRKIGHGSNSCGYIELGLVNYHLDDEGHFLIDRSKQFIFLADFAEESLDWQPSSFAVFQFIQDPCCRALFVSRDAAMYIEKTPETYALCTELDWLWRDPEVSGSVMEAVDDGTLRQRSLPILIKIFEKRKHGQASEMWEFWQTFRVFLMREHLKLSVEAIGELP